MRRLLAPIACIALAGCGDDASERHVPSLADYPMPTPRAIAPLDPIPLDDARFTIEARDVRYADGGTSAAIDRVVTTLSTRGSSEADIFGVTAQSLDDDGAREWRISGDALRLRDLELIGDVRGGRLLPARLTVDMRGRPRAVGTISADVRSLADGATRAHATATLGGSTLVIDALQRASGALDATIRMHPLSLADAHPFVDAVPAHGVARGTLFLARSPGGALRARTDGIALTTAESSVHLAGAVDRGADGALTLDDVAVDLAPVHPDDWQAWLGSAPPVDAPLRGRLTADGTGRDGIAVSGWVLAEDSAGSRLAADVAGMLWLEPQPRLDLAIESRGLRFAQTGPLDLDVRLAGDADSLLILGTGRLAPSDSVHPLLRDLPGSVAERLASATLQLDLALQREGEARRGAGTIALVDSIGHVWFTLTGTAPIGGDGALDVRARADSLPLSLVPVPAHIQNLTGFARLDAHATGTVDAPSLEADAELVGARFDIPEYGIGVDSLRTRIRLAGSRIELVDVQAFRAEGRLALSGGIDLSGPLGLRDPGAAFDGATVAIDALLDTMTVVDMDSARAVVAGSARVTGPLQRPHVDGALALVDGFVFEGRIAPNPPLDPEDPPYTDLVRDAPWPSGRLSAVAGREAMEDAEQGPSAPPLTADLRATVRPDFRIIDEDSDLGALGGVRLVIDDHGVLALGDARIVDGFYAYYGELFQLAGGAFAVDGGTTRLAMSGELRNADRPLGLNQGGYDGLDRRDPPIGIFGYSTPATVLELLRRRSALPATQPELASLLLFDVPLQAVDAWDHELMWRGDEPDDLVGHRSAIQGAGLVWSYVADELYDYVPLDQGYLRAGTIRIGSRYPGWIMLGTQLEAGVHAGPRVTARASHVLGGGTWPGVGLRYALREESLHPADRHVELFNEPRFSTTIGTAGRRGDVEVRRRTGLRFRWLWDY